MPLLDDANLIAATRTFTTRLLARDDYDPEQVCLGLLALIGAFARTADPKTRMMIAFSLRRAAGELEDGQRLN